MSGYTWDYLCAETVRFREAMGSRAVMLNAEARAAALKAFAYVALRCDDDRAGTVLSGHVEEYARRCALADAMPGGPRS